MSDGTLLTTLTQIVDEQSGKAGKELKLYAIVDTAINRKLFQRLPIGDTCEILLNGELAELYEEVAPYLLEISPDDRFSRELLDITEAQNWLSFVSSDKSLAELRSELASHIQAYSEEHEKEIVIRFYDYRNVINYLRIHSEAELQQFFKDISGNFMAWSTNDLGKLAIYRQSKDKINIKEISIFDSTLGQPNSPERLNSA
jgi:hypothetical protein